MNKTIALEKATELIDEVVPKYLALSSMKMKDSLSLLSVIFKRSEPETIDHLKSQWQKKEGEFGSFYLNLDSNHQRMLLQYFDIEVEPDKYAEIEDRILARINGAEEFEIYPFQTHMLNQFLLYANNHSLEEVEVMHDGHILLRHLEQSKLDTYGTGTNWGKFYQYLINQKARERKVLVELTYSYQ
jgi:hypothetical protein